MNCQLENVAIANALQLGTARATPALKNKKERKKESSWVKLKAFPTKVGRPNYASRI